MRFTRRKPKPDDPGHPDGEPPIADGVAIPVAHDGAATFADGISDAHSGDPEPDDRAALTLAEPHHDDRSRVLPS